MAGHRRATTITKGMTNRRGDGLDTPAGARERVARASDPSRQDLSTRADAETIATAIRGVRTWRNAAGGTGWRQDC